MPMVDRDDDPGDPETVAKTICLRLLTTSSHSRHELEQALHRRGVPADAARRVLDRFAEVGLVDDLSYAAAYVDSKIRSRGLGTSALRTDLRRRGIDDEIIATVLAGVDPDSEVERAGALIARRIDAAMAAGPEAARRRLLGMLARRGHSAEVARTVVEQAIEAYQRGLDEAAGR